MSAAFGVCPSCSATLGAAGCCTAADALDVMRAARPDAGLLDAAGITDTRVMLRVCELHGAFLDPHDPGDFCGACLAEIAELAQEYRCAPVFTVARRGA